MQNSQEDALVEAFVAGSISGRNDERNRLHEALVAQDVLLIDYEEYIKVETVLNLLDRGVS